MYSSDGGEGQDKIVIGKSKVRGAKTKFGSTQWEQANQSSTYVSMSRLKFLHHDADHLSSPFM